MALDFDVTRRRHRGAPQSVAAHARLRPRKIGYRMAVLALLRLRPMTAKELALELGRPLHTISGRCAELRRDGLARLSGRVREDSAELEAV